MFGGNWESDTVEYTTPPEEHKKWFDIELYLKQWNSWIFCKQLKNTQPWPIERDCTLCTDSWKSLLSERLLVIMNNEEDNTILDVINYFYTVNGQHYSLCNVVNKSREGQKRSLTTLLLPLNWEMNWFSQCLNSSLSYGVGMWESFTWC